MHVQKAELFSGTFWDNATEKRINTARHSTPLEACRFAAGQTFTHFGPVRMVRLAAYIVETAHTCESNDC